MSTELVKLMVDAYHGKTGTEFTKDQVDDSLRNAIKEILGDKMDYYTFQMKSPMVFALISQALDQIIPNTVEEQFGDFAEVKNTAYGDKAYFELPPATEDRLWSIAVIAEGNGTLRKQRIEDYSNITVSTHWEGVAIYEDFLRFLSGRTNWSDMVSRVAESFNRNLALSIYNTFVATYGTLAVPYKVTGAFDGDAMGDLIQHVEAATNQTSVMVSTKNGLGKVGPSAQMVSQTMMDKYNQLGYYGNFRGTTMRELKQGHQMGTNTFALSDKDILVLPVGGVKPVKVLFEGEAIIRSEQGTDTKDMSMNYTFTKKMGVAVIQTTKYGIYRMP